MKFYYDLLSEPCRAVYFFLKINNVQFEPHKVDLCTGENRKPEFLKINPFHLVPVIDDDGFILTESVAIMRYIAAKYQVAENWFPVKDLQKQARVDEFFNWFHTNLRKHCLELTVTMFRTRMDIPFYPRLPYDAEQIKAIQANVVEAINALDTYFLKGQPFIAGDEISAADLLAYCELVEQDAIGDDTYRCNENVNAWMGRVSPRLEEFAAEPRATLNGFKAAFAAAAPGAPRDPQE